MVGENAQGGRAYNPDGAKLAEGSISSGNPVKESHKKGDIGRGRGKRTGRGARGGRGKVRQET